MGLVVGKKATNHGCSLFPCCSRARRRMFIARLERLVAVQLEGRNSTNSRRIIGSYGVNDYKIIQWSCSISDALQFQVAVSKTFLAAGNKGCLSHCCRTCIHKKAKTFKLARGCLTVVEAIEAHPSGHAGTAVIIYRKKLSGSLSLVDIKPQTLRAEVLANNCTKLAHDCQSCISK